MANITSSVPCFSQPFQNIGRPFLNQPGLPFSQILSAERIARVFAKHGNLFAVGRIYSTAVTLWAFLSQVLRDGKQASCQAAVARVVSHRQQQSLPTPTADTGDYCRARGKLSEAALRELSGEIAEQVEQEADATWRWKEKYHAKLIDGFTFTMPDTPQNQEVYPQSKSQKSGVGFPIARAVAVLSLATACLRDLAIGPYTGKQTGETALLRSLRGALAPGDVAVMDRYYGSYFCIAELFLQDTQVCVRKHQKRHSDFRRGKRLGKYDHLIIWTRPRRPEWMDEATYARMPETLTLREIRFHIETPGRRTQTIDLITTLTDVEEFTKEDLAELFGFRWNCELDIRCLKSYLNLEHASCKSPEMVRREMWATVLGYNLVRTTAATAALLHQRRPRQISFTGTCQYLLAGWMTLSAGVLTGVVLQEYILEMYQQIASCEVADRPGRLEPRVLKRRPKPYKLMQKPRHELKQELRKPCT